MILIIEDDIAVRKSLLICLQQNDYSCLEASTPTEGIELITKKKIDLVILDMNFAVETSGVEGLETLKKIKSKWPSLPVILITGWGHMSLAIDGMKAGAFDFVNKPWDNAYLLDSVRSALRTDETAGKLSDRKGLDKKYNFDKIIGEDRQLVEVLRTVSRVFDTEASVLVLGESGTGKELIAEAIHQNSKRKNKPFVKVNLGGISSSLFESELFGHKRGAFTDAYTDRVGRFEMAGEGTIFLDEIGELDLVCQVKLLRVLQDKKFEVLGSSISKPMNARVVCATNRNLKEMVDQGKFREDLYYRINLITVHLPPLRERREDIPLIVNYFLNNLKKLYQRPYLTIQDEALDWLKMQPWQGNIRELKNRVERTILMSERDMLSLQAFKKQYDPSISLLKADLNFVQGGMTIEEMEISMITHAMQLYNNRITRVANILGLSRNALYRRLEKYKIPYED